MLFSYISPVDNTTNNVLFLKIKRFIATNFFFQILPTQYLISCCVQLQTFRLLKAVLPTGVINQEQRFAVLQRIFHLLGLTALNCQRDIGYYTGNVFKPALID